MIIVLRTLAAEERLLRARFTAGVGAAGVPPPALAARLMADSRAIILSVYSRPTLVGARARWNARGSDWAERRESVSLLFFAGRGFRRAKLGTLIRGRVANL